MLPPPGFQKNAYDDKKRAGCRVSRRSALQTVVSRFVTGIPAGWPSPYKAFTDRLCHPYRRGFLLELYRIPLQARPEETRLAQRNARTGVDLMREIEAGTLLLFPAALSVAFLLWVLWNLLKQDRQIASWLAARRRKSLGGSQRTDLSGTPSRRVILHRG